MTEEELPDFDDHAENQPRGAGGAEARQSGGGISATGFRDFLLKPELMQAIVECGFEHPSEVQHACIPQAVLGTDVLCQAKSGMGKTAVFVMACLQNVELTETVLRALVLCHTRELAYQIEHEFLRLGKFFSGLKVSAAYGGATIEADRQRLKGSCPHIMVGTPGRVLALCRTSGEKEAAVNLDNLKHFIIDECDRCMDALDMRKDIQKIFIQTPQKKQVMMFSATLSAETRATCKKFMQGPHEITVESERKLTLDGLLQYHVKLEEKQKNNKLIELLDALEFNQVVIFVKSVKRALALNRILCDNKFPSMTLHELPREFLDKAKKGDIAGPKDNRIKRLELFKGFSARILVVTDLFGRGMDVERVNIVINYDLPADSDMYLHRVGRAGRFGTKGLAVSFVSTDEDQEIMSSVQSRFEANIGAMPKKVDTTSYLNA